MDRFIGGGGEMELERCESIQNNNEDNNNNDDGDKSTENSGPYAHIPY